MTIAREGSGRDAKRSNRKWNTDTSSWDAWETNYFVYSSVFGKALCEIGATGKKKRTFVSANGSVLARQVVSDADVESVSWEYTDASGQSVRMIGADGTATGTDFGSAELDALGNNVGLHGTLSDPRNSDTYISPSNRRALSAEVQCSIDGYVGDCGFIELIANGRTYFSDAHPLPFQAAPGTARTGRSYDAFSMALYNNSLQSIEDSGHFNQINETFIDIDDSTYGPANGESVVNVRAGNSLFVYVPGLQTGQSLDRGQKPLFDRDRFVSCLTKLFNASLNDGPRDRNPFGWNSGTGGYFRGSVSGLPLTITTAIDRDSAALGKQLKSENEGDPTVTGGPETGLTSGYGLSGSIRNWVASDTVAKYKGVANDQLLIALWVHEVGNGLALARYINSKGTKSSDYGKDIKPIRGYAKETKGLKDPDGGAALENCVYGGIVTLSTGRVGTRR